MGRYFRNKIDPNNNSYFCVRGVFRPKIVPAWIAHGPLAQFGRWVSRAALPCPRLVIIKRFGEGGGKARSAEWPPRSALADSLVLKCADSGVKPRKPMRTSEPVVLSSNRAGFASAPFLCTR